MPEYSDIGTTALFVYPDVQAKINAGYVICGSSAAVTGGLIYADDVRFQVGAGSGCDVVM